MVEAQQAYEMACILSLPQTTNSAFDIILEAFAATEFNEIFSGRQQRQDVKLFQRFGTNSVPIRSVC